MLAVVAGLVITLNIGPWTCPAIGRSSIQSRAGEMHQAFVSRSLHGSVPFVSNVVRNLP